MIAAICAAPIALKAHGIAKGKQVTSYPSMKDELVNDYNYLEDKVVTDGNDCFIVRLLSSHRDHIDTTFSIPTFLQVI